MIQTITIFRLQHIFTLQDNFNNRLDHFSSLQEYFDLAIFKSILIECANNVTDYCFNLYKNLTMYSF